MKNSHNPQAMAIKKCLMVPQLQVVGHTPKKYLSINLFNINVRFYRCVKIWMGLIWQIFGQSSISPNFCGAKVSFHTVQALYPPTEKVELLQVA